MAGLTNHTLMNGLEENLKSSIEFVGGSVPEDTCIWQYPEVIKDQLTANSAETGHIIAGNGIRIERTQEGYIIHTDVELTNKAENITIDHIDAPSWASGLGDNAWEEGTSLQKFLEDLFDNVLPKVPSVIKGDLIITDDNSKDPFAPSDLPDYIDALEANTVYLRLFLASQETPIYISLKEVMNDEINIDLSDYYTKTEVNDKIDIVRESIKDVDRYIKDSLSNIYTKDEIHNIVNSLVDFSQYYTKKEIDDKLAGLISKSENIEEELDNTNESITQLSTKVINNESIIAQQNTQLNNIEKRIENLVSNDMIADIEEAEIMFDNIFKN